MELLSDIKRKVQVRNWIIFAQAAGFLALAAALVAKREDIWRSRKEKT